MRMMFSGFVIAGTGFAMIYQGTVDPSPLMLLGIFFASAGVGLFTQGFIRRKRNESI